MSSKLKSDVFELKDELAQSGNFFRVAQFVKKQNGAWPSSEAIVRKLLQNADKNKNCFERAFKRVGKTVLIDEKEFWDCVDQAHEMSKKKKKKENKNVCK